MDTWNSYNLNVGELYIIKKTEEIVWTILGSCVTIIFYVDKNLALICHAQYAAPYNYKHACSDTCPHPCFTDLLNSNKFKFVTCSIEYMVSYIKRKKIDLRKVHTTLLGGASVTNYKKDNLSMGELNVRQAKESLKQNGIRINREITGGKEGFTVWYFIKGNKITYKRHKTDELINI